MVRVQTKRWRTLMAAARRCANVRNDGAFACQADSNMAASLRVWIAVGVMLAACGRAGAAQPNGTSGLPVPRFVSLKSDKVNVRAGPTKDHDVAWVYNRAALPVEITAEFEN